MFQDVKVEDFDDLDDISNADISCKYLKIWLIYKYTNFLLQK